MIHELLQSMLDGLKLGKLDCMKNVDAITGINTEVVRLINQPNWTEVDKITAKLVLEISNILYNNTDGVILLLDDGVYDMLLEGYKKYDPNFQVGAIPIRFDMSDQMIDRKKPNEGLPFTIVKDFDTMLFYDDMTRYKSDFRLSSIPPFYIDDGKKNMNLRNIAHNHPELVGTLDKCKFVLNKDARDRGVFDSPNVLVFERDFLGKHVVDGLINNDDVITLIAELKYDGISVEATVTDGVIVEARSRGDTAEDLSSDLTPILGGYTFDKAIKKGLKGTIGIQFEAIIMKPYLERLASMGLQYVNARNAIIGLNGRLDGRRFRDFITLVPLKTDMMDPILEDQHLDRLVEIELLNSYFTREVDLKFSIITGNYVSALFQVKKFTEEAEAMRAYLPFMYDGVVISYYDETIRMRLGRKNFVNKYSMAIKFTPLSRLTTFLGYTYTIGQSGVITPMLHYNPVEFYGGIHEKSSGHSYARFQDLGLKIGDVIRLEYTNDVMPYASKPDLEANKANPNPVIPFITNCPVCGAPIKISPSGKSAMCPNLMCRARATARLTNMLAKLNLKDFSESAIMDLQENLTVTFLADLFNLKRQDVMFLGDVNSQKFIDRIKELQAKPIYDYQIIGSLGFSSIAKSKWMLILNKITLHDIMYADDEDLKAKLVSVKGIGKSAAETIVSERVYFMKDLETIIMMPNIVVSYGVKFGKKIRFTGIHDKELRNKLNALGHDASDSSATRDTDILIVPTEGYTSTKTKAVGPNTIIVPMAEFIDNMSKYIG